jgi:hypothetical protein
MVPHMRSKKQRFAFQTFTETPVATPSTLWFGITHHPHEGWDGAKCSAKLAGTPHVIYIYGEVANTSQMPTTYRSLWAVSSSMRR